MKVTVFNPVYQSSCSINQSVNRSIDIINLSSSQSDSRSISQEGSYRGSVEGSPPNLISSPPSVLLQAVVEWVFLFMFAFFDFFFFLRLDCQAGFLDGMAGRLLGEGGGRVCFV